MSRNLQKSEECFLIRSRYFMLIISTNKECRLFFTFGLGETHQKFLIYVIL
jgi:hypothetical protein